jgi:uncharacterized protein
MQIAWDPAKAKRNPVAHDGVTFEEAATVLLDEFALTREDDDAVGEVRFVTLGRSDLRRTLLVIWTQRTDDEIRLISAWKATSTQRKTYEQQFS